ncbi:MAG: outer membrane beta-barrel protein [Nibricoccus sp.]
MKTLLVAVVTLGLSYSAHAQKVGPYVTAGGGVARLQVGGMSVTNPVAATSAGEPLTANNSRSTVAVSRVTVGYNFTENWSAQLSYAKFGTGSASFTFPEYAGVVWGVGGGPSSYLRNDLVYKPTALSLAGSFTYAVTDNTRMIASAGVTQSKVRSRFQTVFKSGAVVANPTYQFVEYSEESETAYCPTISLGLDRKITDQISIGLTGTYSGMKLKIPTAPNGPWTTASEQTKRVAALSAELYLGWHW